MLNRQICKICCINYRKFWYEIDGKDEKWWKIDEEIWDINGIVRCPIEFSVSNTTIYVNLNPPEHCPYALEQLLEQNYVK